MQRAKGVERGGPGCREDLVGEVALAGHGRQPEDPRQGLAHAQPWGQSQRLQQGETPLEEELLQHRWPQGCEHCSRALGIQVTKHMWGRAWRRRREKPPALTYLPGHLAQHPVQVQVHRGWGRSGGHILLTSCARRPLPIIHQHYL